MAICDNGRRAHLGSPIVGGACYLGRATVRLTIEYNAVERDTLDLCADCARLVAADARRHGYTVKRQRLAA